MSRHSAYHRFYGHGSEKRDYGSATWDLQRAKEEEKDKMKQLNNRFVNYIEKVHDLEMANKALLAENDRLSKQSAALDVNVPGMYELELARLRSKLQELEVYTKEVEIERDNLRIDYEETEKKFEYERGNAEEREKEVKMLRKDVDKATIERAKLETKIENLEENLSLEKQVHEAEMDNLRGQIQPMDAGVLNFEPSSAGMPDLNDAILNVRKQYEDFNSKSLDDLDEFYKEKVNSLIHQLKKSQEDARSLRLDIAEKDKIIHRLEREIESLRGQNSGMEKSIEHLNDRLERESDENRELVQRMNNELDDTREDLGKYLKDYQKLNSLNTSLEQEIAIYQKVLAGEEARILEVDTKFLARRASTVSSHHSSRGASPVLDQSI